MLEELKRGKERVESRPVDFISLSLIREPERDEISYILAVRDMALGTILFYQGGLSPGQAEKLFIRLTGEIKMLYGSSWLPEKYRGPTPPNGRARDV